MKFSHLITETKEFKIYCDMDGVLCDFTKAFEEVAGHAINWEREVADERIWKEINKDVYGFFKNLEWLPDGKKLWNYLKDKNVEILSSVGSINPDPDGAKKGKREWLAKNNIDVPIHLTNRATEKQKYANANSILIDDYDKNIEEWNAAGGYGIQFTTAEKAIKELEEILNEI